MSDIEIYKSPDNKIELQVNLEKDTVWLSQKQMAELFDKDADTIGLHLKNIFTEEELEEKSTTEVFSVVQKEGKRSVSRKIKYYNLDAIISVGYRVNSQKATRFRIWATGIIKKHLVKGYTLNEKRLQQVQQNMEQLQQAVKLIRQSGNTEQLSMDFTSARAESRGQR